MTKDDCIKQLNEVLSEYKKSTSVSINKVEALSTAIKAVDAMDGMLDLLTEGGIDGTINKLVKEAYLQGQRDAIKQIYQKTTK